MTIQEAYYIFYGPTTKEITREVIEKELTKEIVIKDYHKLSKKYHPDLNKGKEKESSEKMKLINVAKEVLLDACKLVANKENKENEENKKSEAHKTVSGLLHATYNELEELIPAYLKIVNYAFKLREYKIKTDLYKNAKYYCEEIKNSISPVEIYKSIQEFNAIDKQARLEFSTLKSLLQDVKNLINSQKYTAESLILALKNIAGEFYESLDDLFFQIEVENWFKNEIEKDTQQYKDNLSYIKNIKNILKKLLTNSKTLNNILCQTALNEIASNTTKNINSGQLSLVGKIEEIDEYRQKRLQYTARIKGWNATATSYLKEILTMKDSQIDEAYLTTLEAKLYEVISDNYLPLLNDTANLSKLDNRKHRKDTNEYKVNNLKLEYEYKKLLIELKDKIKEIKQTLSINKSTENLDVKSQINLLTSYEKKLIVSYYEAFICYSVNKDSVIIPKEVESIYEDMFYNNNKKLSELDAKEIDMYYNILTYKYNQFNLQEQSLTRKDKTEVAKKLIYYIKDLVDYLKSINEPIPEKTKELLPKMDELSVIELYKLYEYIEKSYFYKTFKEYPIKKS